MTKRILFYPIMTNKKRPDHFMGDYNPLSKELTKRGIEHCIVNKSTDRNIKKVIRRIRPTDVVFRLPGLRVSDIKYLKDLKIRTHTLQHGWPVKSSAHLPINTDTCYVWSDLCRDFYSNHGTEKNKMTITGSPRYDPIYDSRENKKFNKIPIIGFNSIPYYIWKHKDCVNQALTYARAVYSLDTKAFPRIIQRLHPHEQTNGWIKHYKNLKNDNRVTYENPYSRSPASFFNDIDILVTTQSGTIIEAAMLGIPCVSMLFFNKTQYVTNGGYPISIHIETPSSLEKALVIAYGTRGQINQNVFKYHAFFDGKCSERVVDQLLI